MSEMPRGWVEITLNDLCEFNPKHDPETDRSLEVNFVPMPAVDDETGTIADKSNVRPLSEVWKGYTHFSDEDVIFAKITPCMENGKIAVARDLANGMACGSTEFHVLRSKGAVEPDYLWRFLRRKSFRKLAERSMTGAVGQRRVPKQFLEATVLALPPLAEQKRIVAKLDALNAKSARARTELARIETLVSRYKQAVLSKAFSGELTREWRKVTSTTWPWRSVLWSDCGETLNGRAFPSGDYCDSGVKLLRPGNLGASGDVFWNEKNTRFLPKKYAVEFPKHFIKGEAILINLTAQSLEDQFLARACLSSPSDEFMLNQRIGLFRPRNMIPKFCLFALKSPGFRSFVDNGMNSGSLIQHVHTKQLERYQFDVPEIEEQHEIVRRIESAFAKIDRLAAEARRALNLVGKLDEAILAKAFRGELVPQDENDEPAEKLLERIRAERAAAPKGRRGRGRH